jgi:hypothetical protein
MAIKKFNPFESMAILICYKVYGYSKLDLAEIFKVNRHTITNTIDVNAVSIGSKVFVNGILGEEVKKKAHEFLREKNIHILPVQLSKMNIKAVSESEVYEVEKKLIDKFEFPTTDKTNSFNESAGKVLIGLAQGLERISEQINYEELSKGLTLIAQAAMQLEPKSDSEYVEIFSMDISKTTAPRLRELSDSIEDFNIEPVYNADKKIVEEEWCFIQKNHTRESNLLFANGNLYSHLRAFPSKDYNRLSIRSESGEVSAEKIIEFFKGAFSEIEILIKN